MDVVSRPSVVAGLRLVRLVGRGGEGEVWEARDERGRRRALKLIRPEMLAAEMEERLQSLLHIDHPSMVRTFRGGRLTGGGLDGWGFVEMDYVDGPSLHEAPADPAVLERLEPLAQALDLLHAGEWSGGRPLVHRDVKPANLVMRNGGGIVLVDPSTLRALDSNTVTRVGTPGFAAPEVMTGRISPAADVYSFAATIVALLTGERGERLATYLEHVDDLDLPDGVSRALSLRPADRPSSCQAVLAAGMEADPTVMLPPWPGGEWPEDALPVDEYGDGYDDGDDDLADEPLPRSPWAWVGLLLLLVGGPVMARVLGFDAQVQLVVAGVSAALHVLACVAAREPLALTLLTPPLAWADLLARRLAPRTLRRDWARAVLAGALLVVTAAVVVFARPGLVQLPVRPAAAVGLALAGFVVAVAILLLTGVVGFLGRVAVLPLWALGAAVIVVGGLLISPFAHTARMAGRTLVSAVETLRRPFPDDLE